MRLKTNNRIVSAMIELQMKLLGDTARNDAFYRALKAVIKPGQSTMADIGSGTGFLCFIAEKLGAKTCYGYESDAEIFSLSKKLATENKIKKCKFYNMHSVDVTSPPKVDIVVSETLGNYALEENIIETLRDAKRFLKPGGIILPQKLTQYIAPVINPQAYEKINVWDDVGYGITMKSAKKDALANMYVQTFQRSDLLTQADAIKIWDEIDFASNESSIRKSKVEWELTSPQTVYGFAVWWNAALIPGVHLSTGILDVPTHWEQIFFPLINPIKIKKGEHLIAEIASDSRYSIGIHVTWKVRVKK